MQHAFAIDIYDTISPILSYENFYKTPMSGDINLKQMQSTTAKEGFPCLSGPAPIVRHLRMEATDTASVQQNVKGHWQKQEQQQKDMTPAPVMFEWLPFIIPLFAVFVAFSVAQFFRK